MLIPGGKDKGRKVFVGKVPDGNASGGNASNAKVSDGKEPGKVSGGNALTGKVEWKRRLIGNESKGEAGSTGNGL